MKNKSDLTVIFLTVFIDILGFGLVVPLLPSFMENELHQNESMTGFVVGIFSLMQFLFVPFWGAFSDRYGRRPILIISLAGSVVSYIMLALVFSGFILSNNLLIVSRTFAGIFAANISAAIAAVSDITKPEERTRGIGIVSAAFSLGFVFGPAIGGVLSQNLGFGFPVYVSIFLAAAALLLCLLIFKETLPQEIQFKNRREKLSVNPMKIKLFTEVITNKSYGKYVIIFFTVVFSFSNLFGTMQLFGERKEGLNLSQGEVGYLFSFMGLCGAAVQLFLLKLLQKITSEENICLIGTFIGAIGMGFMGHSVSVGMLLFFIMVLSFGNGFATTVSLSLLSQKVSPDRQGTVLGINHSLGSFARFLGPTCGGIVYQFLGYKAPFITGGLFFLLITIYGYAVIKK